MTSRDRQESLDTIFAVQSLFKKTVVDFTGFEWTPEAESMQAKMKRIEWKLK
jgi:hypothetical protein